MSRKSDKDKFGSFIGVLTTLLFIICIFAYFMPQKFESSSLFDLIVNNLVLIILNGFIAFYISVVALHQYESRKQELIFKLPTPKCRPTA